MTGWVIRSIMIEGLRGINNEGDPLILNLEPDGVNSIFAPNAVGKTSIFDALLFAIRGCINKLDTLPAAEKGRDYYRNRFHSTGLGFVEIAFASTAGQADATVRVSLDAMGKRIVSSPDYASPDELLQSLDREFALLDYQSFQKFIIDNPTDRGRSFSGLLGLSQYSQTRQRLQGLDDTRAFRNKFQTAALDNEIRGKDQTIGSNNVLVHRTAASALGKKPEDFADATQIEAEIESKLATTVPIITHCAGKKLDKIDFVACISAITEAEGGEKKQAYTNLVNEEAKLKDLSANVPPPVLLADLPNLARIWEEALDITFGADRLAVYKAAEKVLGSDDWTTKELCPACDKTSDKSVLEHVKTQLELFRAAEEAEESLSQAILTLGLHNPLALEVVFKLDAEAGLLTKIKHRGSKYTVSSENASAVVTWIGTLNERLNDRVQKIAEEKLQLEKELPESLVSITNLVGECKTIARALAVMLQARAEKAALEARRDKLTRLKGFLSAASAAFGIAEGKATDRRLKKVQPKARELFTSIMSDDVIADVKKGGAGEAVILYLEKFFDKTDLSALALLSESYRNALAVSLYLAAASLYGGDAKFIVLDDVTSSFDGGHQFYLMEAIKNKIARPSVPDGLQFIVLSHDTLLEKLFIKNGQTPGWSHQKIEGTPRLVVAPTSGSAAKLRAAVDKNIAGGHLVEAANGVRMLLEAKLIEIISRVRIPVPLDFAISDHKKMVENCVKAIQDAISLHALAGSLKMTPSQVTDFSTNAVSVIGNFLSHYSTGSTSAFTQAALKQALQVIDNLSSSFQTEDPPASGNLRYIKSLSKL